MVHYFHFWDLFWKLSCSHYLASVHKCIASPAVTPVKVMFCIKLPLSHTLHEKQLSPVLHCLLQEPRWWQWRRLTPMTPPRITPRCATTSSDSRQTSRPRICSTSTQKEATLSLSSHPRYLTERWVDFVFMCVASLCTGWQSVTTWNRERVFTGQSPVTSPTHVITSESQLVVHYIFCFSSQWCCQWEECVHTEYIGLCVYVQGCVVCHKQALLGKRVLVRCCE